MSEDLIRRSDAIKAIEVVDWYHQNKNKDMVSGANSDEHQAWYKAEDVYKALEAVPTADKLAVIRVKSVMKKEDYESLVDSIRNQAPNVIVTPHNTELVSPTDRPQGEWIEKNVDDVKITVCSNCDKEPTFTHYYGSCGNYSLSDFCPNCGADMRKGADDE